MLPTCRARFVYVFLRHQQRLCGYESELDSRAEPGIHGGTIGHLLLEWIGIEDALESRFELCFSTNHDECERSRV